jgi:hypothetical protein
MRNGLLRSVLVAAFSAVVAFGTLSGLSAVKGDARTSDVSSTAVVSAGSVDVDGEVVPYDSRWS